MSTYANDATSNLFGVATNYLNYTVKKMELSGNFKEI